MQKVRQEYEVIRAAPIHGEGAAGKHRIPLGNIPPTCIFRRDRQHVGPVQRRDVRLAVALGDRDAEQPMSRGDIEHAQRLSGVSTDQARE